MVSYMEPMHTFLGSSEILATRLVLFTRGFGTPTEGSSNVPHMYLKMALEIETFLFCRR